MLVGGLASAYALFIVYKFYELSDVIIDRQGRQPQYPQFADFAMASVYCVGFTVIHYFAREFLRPVARAFLVKKGKWSEEVYEAKLHRFGSAIFKAVWFGSFSLYTYYIVLKDASWFPPILGGSGDSKNCWSEGYPFQLISEEFRFYYCLATGYHASELLFQLAFERDRPDLAEMLLHHMTTLFLLVFSYMMNFARVGSLVLFVHDVSDVPTYLAKIFVDSKYKVMTFLCLLMMLASWGYLRLYVFPMYIINSTMFESVEVLRREDIIGWYFFNGMLCILCVLHVYWYSMFIRMGYHYVVKGETKDMQANLQAMEKPKAQ
mmetsp:Transcript_4972/g.10893  ORF Transcript_4972/g.10893 Transcript_4972/m.10893 type:complete len:320 (-) Transcript_4972:287-1246(-)